jgi:hypothetical protein
MEEFQVCTKCKVNKPLSSFSNNCNMANGKMTQCKQCIKERDSKKNIARITEGNKICSMCGIEQNVNEFNSCKIASDGLASNCKKCSRIKTKKWVESDIKNFIKKAYLSCKHNCSKRSKDLEFNITEQDIIDLYYKQEGKCALSGEKLTSIVLEDNGINDFNLSIDRKDSSKGYTKDNIQLVGAIINIMKNDLDEKDFLLFVSTIAINSILDDRMVSNI